jgi:hypothetical protein
VNGKPSTPLLIGIIVVLIAVLGFFFYRTANQNKSQQPSGVSGTLNINGTVPNGATVTLSAKEANTAQGFTEFANGVPATDGGDWTFGDAASGKNYEIKASLVANGKTITTADPIFVSAPATGESLVFSIENTSSTNTSVISGTIDLNGYIPQGSTITVEGKLISETAYTAVVTNLPAKDGQSVTYSTAIAGRTYDVVGTLFDTNGQVIGTSKPLQVTAPAKGETLTINSTAQPPATPTPAPNTPTPAPTNAAISGSINFNGAAQPNTRIVIFQRVTGSGNNFQVAQDNISPQNGVTWQWSGAQAGTSYDLFASYKLRNANGTDTDLSDSSIITVAAPASNETFTINSGYSVPQNNGQISSSCGNYNSGNNTWNATVTFGAIPNAQSYWIQIGTSNGGNQLTNFTANANNQPQLVYNYTVQNNTTYYARYAYAFTPNLQANSNDFSPFSNTVSFNCTN